MWLCLAEVCLHPLRPRPTNDAATITSCKPCVVMLCVGGCVVVSGSCLSDCGICQCWLARRPAYVLMRPGGCGLTVCLGGEGGGRRGRRTCTSTWSYRAADEECSYLLQRLPCLFCLARPVRGNASDELSLHAGSPPTSPVKGWLRGWCC